MSFSLETNAVYVFFIISGYFIYQSALTRDVLSYVMSRIARIMPGLLGNIILYVIIGDIYTNIFVGRYISVFNGILWTLPIEVVSYIKKVSKI